MLLDECANDTQNDSLVSLTGLPLQGLRFCIFSPATDRTNFRPNESSLPLECSIYRNPLPMITRWVGRVGGHDVNFRYLCRIRLAASSR